MKHFRVGDRVIRTPFQVEEAYITSTDVPPGTEGIVKEIEGNPGEKSYAAKVDFEVEGKHKYLWWGPDYKFWPLDCLALLPPSTPPSPLTSFDHLVREFYNS